MGYDFEEDESNPREENIAIRRILSPQHLEKTEESWIGRNKYFVLWAGIWVLIGLWILVYGMGHAKYLMSQITKEQNMGPVIELCTNACERESASSYCRAKRTLYYGQEIKGATHLIPGGQGFEPVTRPTDHLVGTCYEMARGIIREKNNKGIEQDFQASFPGVKIPLCENLCNKA